MDYSPIEEPVTRSDIRDFRRSVEASPDYAGQATPVQVSVALTAATLMAVFVIGISGIFAALLRSLWIIGLSPGSVIVLAIPLVFGGGGALLIVNAARYVYPRAVSWERWLLLSRYAASNGFQFEPAQEAGLRASLPPASAARINLAGLNLRRGIVAGALVFAVVFAATWVIPFITR